MTYRADWPETLAAQLAYVQAETATYRAKLMAERAADPLLQRLFGVLPDAHMARLEAELQGLEHRAKLPQA